jgi:hypothetical protein
MLLLREDRSLARKSVRASALFSCRLAALHWWQRPNASCSTEHDRIDVWRRSGVALLRLLSFLFFLLLLVSGVAGGRGSFDGSRVRGCARGDEGGRTVEEEC